MQKFFRLCGLSLASVGIAFIFGAANAADSGRAGYAVGSMNASSRAGFTSSQRMPTMPTLPVNSIGNLSPNVPSGGGGGVVPPGPDPDPDPDPECPDGGVRNSTYTVENCMNDVLSCVNSGALPGGLNDLFNEDLRNAIFNGMSLCYVQVEKCVTEVRKDCRNIYNSSSDVWIDFNSRKVQPEYYAFVLRKTGLTPNQAENTCWLLDRNTFGSSFTAVSNSGNVTAEYANRVGAYNEQAGGLQKTLPQGVTVNSGSGVDGQRGHYARWDATTAECLVRVAAYNKDSHIKNSWLFGALGDDKPAEVWIAAGGTFSCNKDLFGFSLMNKTSTTAVVGIGGGTLVGAGVGAIAGHGARDFDCTRDAHRKELTKQLREGGNTGILNEYLDGVSVSATGGDISVPQCNGIVILYNLYQQAKSADKSCSTASSKKTTSSDSDVISGKAIPVTTLIDGKYFEYDGMRYPLDQAGINLINSGKTAYVTFDYSDETTTVSGNNGCPKFHNINKAKMSGTGIYCNVGEDCISGQDLTREVNRLGSVMDSLKILQGEKSNMLKSTLVGAGVGAATGGLATAITAFVEKSNISCRVGDGLDKVSFGKSYSLGSLKDYYVKWNLRVPDTIMPTAQVVDCASWKAACAMLKDLNQCAAAQINYRPADANYTTLINTACKISGSVCIENHPVTVSHGACE